MVSDGASNEMQHFVRSLLCDVRALEHMIKNDWFETDVKRIGAEQELCLINKHYKPAYKAMDILEHFHPDWLTTELAQFNLEVNLAPQVFTGSAFSDMEKELRSHLAELEKAAAQEDVRILLTGILPSLRKFDLNLERLTPIERYYALMQALRNLRGSDYELRIEGIDELNIRHDSPLLEACNTSFQVHLQVTPDTFVPMYNIAQAVAGPVLAMAANSPLLFGRRLWHETRIALFQQSIDNRKSNDHLRDSSPRVTFGKDWLHKSILDIYKEDIVRFRVILGADIEENAFDSIRANQVPKLKALQVHNGTVYRWNRPCYGISPNGKPHLRIENRVIGAGPTVTDEMANTAFWLGLMEGMYDEYGDIRQQMGFVDARDNFFKAARTGIDSKFTWVGNQKINAGDLLRGELLPLARHGLELRGIDSSDINHYLDVIAERGKHHMNGARWTLKTFTKFARETTRDEALTTVTAAMLKNQNSSLPIHEWPIPELSEFDTYNPSKLLVEEFMRTELFTVQKTDILDLVADIMDWQKIRYMPVENDKGELEGLITARLVLRHFSRRRSLNGQSANLVEDVMIKNPLTVTPSTSILEAIRLMNEHQIGALPVVRGKELMGIITEKNFVIMSKRLIRRMYELEEEQKSEETEA